MNRKKLLILTAAVFLTVNLTACSIFKPKSSNLPLGSKPVVVETKPSASSETNNTSQQNNSTDTSQQTNSTTDSTDSSTNSSSANTSASQTPTKKSSNNGNTGNSGNSGNQGNPNNPGDKEPDEVSDWTLAWSDEFNGTSLDTSKWSYDIGNAMVDKNGNKVTDGWGNNELEYYTNSTKNVSLQDGKLVIKAIKETSPEQFGKTFDYTSGKIKTLGKYSMKYGKIDIRAKMPVGKGFWPAIWMLPANDVYGGWAASGEIDIAEGWGSRPQTVAGTLHYGGTWPNNRSSGKEFNFPSTTSVAKFHTYSLEWEPGEIRWYIDGELYQTQNNWYTKGANGEEKYSFPAPFDQEFYVILNLAVGGNFDGNPTVDTQFPSTMEVDYVRAYDLTIRPYKTPQEPKIIAEPLPEGSRAANTDGNLLYNGDFSEPIQDNPENPNEDKDFGNKWNFVHQSSFGAVTSQSIEKIDNTNYAKIDITNGGTQPYSIQLMQLVTLGKGRYYKVSFDAKAADTRTMNMKMGGGPDRGWALYSEDYRVDLTKEFKHYEYIYQMRADSDINARLELNFGLNTNTVWIGNVRVDEIDPPAEDFNASKEPLASGNHIYNGAFDKGLVDRMTYWNFLTNGAVATASVPEDTRELTVDIASSGTNAQDLTVDQRGIQLQKGNIYKLSFKARAAADRTMKVKFASKSGETAYLNETTVNLTNTMETKTIEFKMDQATDLESQLIFMLGGNSSKVYIDDVSLTKTSVDYSNVELYPLKNGDFSDELTSWKNYVNYDAGANISVVDGQAKIAIDHVGAETWGVQLYQENLTLEKDIEYVIAFDARSTSPRNMEIVLDNASYNRYLSQTIALGTETKHYEFTLKPSSADTVNLKYLIGKTDGNVPTGAHDVFIDNVKFEVKGAKFISSILKNGTFDGTLDPWNSWTGEGGAASVSLTDENAMKIAVTNAGNVSYAVQAFQEGIKFENGQKYSVSFKAKADEARKMNVNIGKALSADPWYIAFADTQTVDLTNTMKEYAFEFTMNKDTYDNGKIVFELGNVTGGNAATNIYIDDVAINKVSASSDPDPATPPITTKDYSVTTNSSNILLNGNFDNDTTAWDSWWGDQWSGFSTGTVAAENGKMKIHLESIGGATYSPQVFQQGFKLENGKTYVVSFKAKADIARKLNVNIGKALSSDPWFRAYAPTKTVDIATTEQQYTYAFNVTEATDSDLKIVFEAGNVAGGNAVTDIYLDDITIQEVTSGTAPTDLIVTNSTDVVQNGTFSTDTANWDSWWGDQWSGFSTGTVSAENGEMKIHLESIGGATYSPQVFQQGLKLENGKTYVVNFKAKADIARKLNINIGKALSSDPWFRAYAPSKTVDITTVEQEYTYVFKVTEATDSDLKIVFEIGNVAEGNAVTDIYLDDISIQEVTSGTSN